ncbi:hypothetical protein ACQP2T_27955 [Nonomuraea sp. CA-143628]|uniref:hypothetical protein n=1 Tax=Nonomuraea sp. CA-143628 TaxID=3239997 RepID=UPI003D913AE4
MMAQRPSLVPLQRLPEQEHTSWCVNHIPGENAGDFGTCMANDLTVDDAFVGLNSNADAGIRIDLGFTGTGTSVDDAERIALAILCQVARARGLTPPADVFAAVTA